MNPFRTGLYVIFILLFQHSIFAQDVKETDIKRTQLPEFLTTNSIAYYDYQTQKAINYNLLAVNDSIIKLKSGAVYPPEQRDYKRLGYASGMYIGATVAAFGFLWSTPESVSNWDKEEIRKQGILWKWKRNIKEGPVWDEDDFVLNYVTHPYSGGVYYMTARSSGFTVLESFAYSAIMSTFFWEYGIESFAEVPSTQDLFITPILGSMVGEGFFYAKKSILKHDRRVLKSRFLGYTSLLLMDPFNTLLDSFGYKEKVKTQMNFAPIGYGPGIMKSAVGFNLMVQF